MNGDAVIESAVSSGDSKCRVEAVAKAHISELTHCDPRRQEVFEPAGWYSNLRTWTWRAKETCNHGQIFRMTTQARGFESPKSRG